MSEEGFKMKETVKVAGGTYQPSGSWGGASDGPSCVVGVAGAVIGRAKNSCKLALEMRRLAVPPDQLFLLLRVRL